MRLTKSTTFRITVTHLAFFCVSVLMLFAAVYLASTHYMRLQVDKTIQQTITYLAENYQRRGLLGLRQTISQRLQRMQPIPDALYLLSDASFNPIVGNLLSWPQKQPGEDGWIDFKISYDDDSVLRARARAFQLAGGYRLLVGRSTDLLDHSAHIILWIMITGMITTMLLGTAAGVMMTRRINQRLMTIHRTARAIQKGQISQRIPVSKDDDEFDRLILQLNYMLNQIEQLMNSLSAVSDNIAHDLRTPLTRLNQHLSLLEQSAQLSDEDRELVLKALDNSHSLLDTFNALLRIARIEAGHQGDDFQTVNLAELLRDIEELYEPLAHSKKQTLNLNRIETCLTQGNKDLLFQCLANLTDNAIKYAQGSIQMELTQGQHWHQLVISDNGPGIPPQLQKQVFERFFRLDQSRVQPGSGLGLSLVDAIIKLHGAKIDMYNTYPGLAVRVQFPAEPQQSSKPNP